MSGAYGDSRLGTGDSPLTDGRLRLFATVIVLSFVVFTVRLFLLQFLEGDDLRSLSLRNFVRTVVLEAPRGVILDREGRVLAANRPAYRVRIIPNEMTNPGRTFEALAQLLERESDELRARVGTPRGRLRFQPVELDGDMGYDRRARVESHRFALPGVVTDIRPLRHYVESDLAAHLLGSIGEIHPNQLDRKKFASYRAGDIVGQAGLESTLEGQLRGRKGGRNVIVDVAGREISEIDEIAPAA